MKRSSERRKSPAEVTSNMYQHYGGLEVDVPTQKAVDVYKRKPYAAVKKYLHEVPDE